MFQSFIPKNFSSAYAILDEISMKGNVKNKSFADRDSSNSSDMLLVHHGTIKFWKMKRILTVLKVDEALLTENIKRALVLKKGQPFT